jgi:hypothetical protein
LLEWERDWLASARKIIWKISCFDMRWRSTGWACKVLRQMKRWQVDFEEDEVTWNKLRWDWLR